MPAYLIQNSFSASKYNLLWGAQQIRNRPMLIAIITVR